jgi:O-antigen/teichoic acid export membrane protein
MSHKQFVKDVIIVGSTQILVNSSSFLLLPIIAKTLGVYDYGIWSQLTVTRTLLTFLAILGLSAAFIRFFPSKTDKKEISKGFFSIFFFIALLSLVISGILIVFSTPISQFLFDTSTYSPLIPITSFLIILNALYTIAIFYFRIYRQMLVYAGLTIFTSIGQIPLTIFLLVYLGYGIYGVVYAALFSYLVPLVIALIIIIKQVGFSFPSLSEMPKYLRFSLPLAPSSLIFWITTSSDRYIIGFLLGASSVGIYSAGYNIGYLIYLFVIPLQIILLPELSKLHDKGEIEEVKTYTSYSLKFFLLIAIPSVVGFTVLANQILVLLTTTKFINGSSVIPIVGLSALFSGLFQIIINICILYKKTIHNFWIQACSAILNLCLNFLLIPIIGIIGAAIATLFSFMIMCILAYIVSKKYLRFKIDILFISKIILSSILMGLIILLLKEQISVILLILIGIATYFIFCYVFKIFNKQEISFLKNMIRFPKHSD